MNFWTRDREKEGDLDLEAANLDNWLNWVGSGWEKEEHAWKSKERSESRWEKEFAFGYITLGDCGTLLLATGV